MYTDTHAHLDDERYENQIEDIINKARDAKVNKIVCSAYNLKSSENAVSISNKYENVFASIGFHPQNVCEFDENTLSQFEKLVASKKVVAVGEAGLEYTRGDEDRVLQKQVFEKLINFAIKHNLPLVVHSRDACEDTVNILKKYAGKLNAVVHCFSYSEEIMQVLTKLGYYISVGGVVSFKNARTLKQVVASCPLDKIMLETDCPYLAPEPYRGKTNMPAYIKEIYESIVELRQEDRKIIQKQIEENVKNFYKI